MGRSLGITDAGMGVGRRIGSWLLVFYAIGLVMCDTPLPPNSSSLPSPNPSSPPAVDAAALNDGGGARALPYRIAVLCYLFDEAGNILLLHRAKAPNFDLYSPIGGKLEFDLGESPTMCALREIEEEAGIVVAEEDIALVGIVSERSFEDAGHWLLFCFEVTKPVEVVAGPHEEGLLEWHGLDEVLDLNIPRTDREIIWPAFLKHRGGGFFMLHVECGGVGGELRFTMDESRLGGEGCGSG